MAFGFNLERSVSTLTSGAFMRSAALIVGGSITGDLATRLGREYVVDIQFRGADAAYALGASAAMLAVLPAQFGRPMALGSAASAVGIAAEEVGVYDALGL